MPGFSPIAKGADVRKILTRIGDPTGHTLNTLVAKLCDPSLAIGALLEHGTYGLAQLARASILSVMEHEIGFPSLEALDPITALPPPDQDTTELSVTVTLPEGGHIVRAYLIALITAMNNKANVQTIDVDVKGRVAGGSWHTYFSETNCIGVIPLIGATAYLTAVQDIGPTCPSIPDRIVTDANLSGTPPSGVFGFKCTIVLDSANEVRFTTQYVLIIAYRMS